MEFTVDQVMELIHYEEDSSAKDLSLIRQMVSSCRQLFSTVLGYAHGYKMSIKTRLIDEDLCSQSFSVLQMFHAQTKKKGGSEWSGRCMRVSMGSR